MRDIMWHCKECDCLCSSSAQYQQHIIGSKHKKKCIEKNNNEKKTSDIGSKNNDFTCESCDAVLKSVPDLLAHQCKTDHTTESTNPNLELLRCELCSIDCNSIKSKEAHDAGKLHLKKLRANAQSINQVEKTLDSMSISEKPHSKHAGLVKHDSLEHLFVTCEAADSGVAVLRFVKELKTCEAAKNSMTLWVRSAGIQPDFLSGLLNGLAASVSCSLTFDQSGFSSKFADFRTDVDVLVVNCELFHQAFYRLLRSGRKVSQIVISDLRETMKDPAFIASLTMLIALRPLCAQIKLIALASSKEQQSDYEMLSTFSSMSH